MRKAIGKCFQAGMVLLFGVNLVQAQQTASPAVLDQLQLTAQEAITHISALRIEKWKADSATKRSAQNDADSLQRNMASALPELVAKVRSAPQDLNANFRLYRNVEVLYDVFSRFTEMSGAFGPKDDYETLARDLSALESARHALGDTLDGLTAALQGELNLLRSQIRAAQQAAAAPPKRVVVDDTQPQRRKKPAAKSGTSSTPPPAPAK